MRRPGPFFIVRYGRWRLVSFVLVIDLIVSFSSHLIHVYWIITQGMALHDRRRKGYPDGLGQAVQSTALYFDDVLIS